MEQETICQNQFLDNLGVMIHKVSFCQQTHAVQSC